MERQTKNELEIEKMIDELVKTLNNYDRKDDILKLKTEIDFVKSAKNFVLIVLPFLEYVKLMYSSLKLEVGISKKDLKDLKENFSKLENVNLEILKDRIRSSINQIYLENFETFEKWNGLILAIITKYKNGDSETTY
jgi:hypothetical protein